MLLRIFKIRTAFISLLLCLLCTTSCFNTALNNSRIRPAPAIAAHRGYHQDVADNSLNAIRKAIELETPYIEIDIRESTEGKLFLFHDRTIRATNVSEPINLFETKVETLSEENVKSIIRSGTARDKVAFFNEALKLLQNSKAKFLIDIKSNNPQATISKVIENAKELELADKIIIQTQLIEQLRSLKSKYPEIKALSRCRNHQEVVEALGLNPEIIQVDLEWITENSISLIHQNKSKVLVKSLGEEKDKERYWLELYNRGVDIILTDRPKSLSNFLNPSLTTDLREKK
ncbi:MAG: hypothetical protein KBC84_06525 [Proteobacteria bacterium]|nr:hypothetical protein [Pseudomonadota bacterium]